MCNDQVTGRDSYIIAKALAYAITIIELLPEQWQEWSDCQDMKAILAKESDSAMSEAQRSAAAHIYRAIAEMTPDEFAKWQERAKEAAAGPIAL